MRKIIKIFFLLLIPESVCGQITPLTSQYVLNPLVINPAAAGNRGVLNVAAFYRKQWVGVKGSPETITLTADAPFRDERMGLGIIVMSDKIGVTKETHIKTDYSYKVAVGKGNLSFGLGAGVTVTNTAWSKLIVLEPEDDLILTDDKGFVVPSFSFGTYYSDQRYFAGISIPKLLGYKFDTDKKKYVINNNMSEYYYLFNTGYLFDLSSGLKFLPSALIAFSPGDEILYDINAHFMVMDRLWFGASYRNNRSIVGMLQVQLTDQIKFAYTYDYDFARLRTFSSGSHEVMLRYEFRYKVQAISPLNF
ncbi:MAG: type IX secretion system membrane protein PorP/SprF [Bacteroidales bacterium]|nr:type IX secretion system membrane protein PorP/SprF [Bacteroidales bacterium]